MAGERPLSGRKRSGWLWLFSDALGGDLDGRNRPVADLRALEKQTLADLSEGQSRSVRFVAPD